MRKHHWLFLFAIFCVCINACKKEDVLPPFNETFTEPYTTGSIRFRFYKINPDRPSELTRRQQVDFTATFENADEWMCGYYRPDIRLVTMLRINPSAETHRAGVHFYDLNLDSLPLPYTFNQSDNFNAQVEYTLGDMQFKDSSGHIFFGPDGFVATTKYSDFTLTLISKSGNRLKGTFGGTLKHIYNVDLIKIEKGIFDVEYVVR